MRLAYQYKIKPTSEQKLKLNHVRRVCQYVYNRMLRERMDWWEKNRCPINACPLICHLPDLKPNPTYLSQQNALPDLKKDLVLVKWSGELLDLTEIYSHILQDGWYRTLTLEDKTVPEFTSDSIEPTWENSLGIDAVLHEDVFIATSDKELLPARKAYRTRESKLKNVAAKKSAKKKGSCARRKLAKKEARIHQKIARSRKDHHYKTAHRLAKTEKKVFFVEDLEILNLTKRNQVKTDDNGHFLTNGQSYKSGLNKSFLDAGFGQFVDILSHVVAKTGGQVVKVKPNYTSQICCECDEYVPKKLSDRIHSCPNCGLVLDRDILAAINTKRVGVDVFPTIKRRRAKIVVISTNSNSKEFLIGSPTHNL